MIASCPSRFPEHGSADRLPGVSRTHASASAWVPGRPLPRAPSPACDARSSTSCAHAVPARFPVSAASGPPSSSAPPALVSPSLSLPCRSHVWSPRPSRRCLPSRTTPRHLDQPFTFPLRDLRPPWRPLSAVLCGCREASAGIVRRGFPLARPVFTRSPGRPRPQASSVLLSNFPWGNDTTKVTVPDDSLGFTTSALPPAADAPPVVPGPGGLVAQSLLAEGRASLSGVNGAEASVLSDRICWLCF